MPWPVSTVAQVEQAADSLPSKHPRARLADDLPRRQRPAAGNVRQRRGEFDHQRFDLTFQLFGSQVELSDTLEAFLGDGGQGAARSAR